jgi:hypothetical protein
MLDPKIVALANDRIRLEIAEQNKRVSEDISRINSEMAMRGTLRSGGTIKRITSLCSDATKDRAQMAWTSPPYTFFLLNGDMELYRDWQILV